MEKKKTKKDIYAGIKATLEQNFDAGEVAEYVEFIDKEIAAIDARAEKEKARRAEKKAERDYFRDTVKEVIGAEPITGEAIVKALIEEYPDVTKAKVAYRTGQLVKAGEIYKVQIKTEDGRKVVAYTNEAPAEEE